MIDAFVLQCWKEYREDTEGLTKELFRDYSHDNYLRYREAIWPFLETWIEKVKDARAKSSYAKATDDKGVIVG